MVLVDTSVWIDHFCKSNNRLKELLEENLVSTHPFIIGELACGQLKNRKEILELMNFLPSCPVISPLEYLKFIETHNLNGKGIGFVDIHILASSLLSGEMLWTMDKKLLKAGKVLKVLF